MMKASMAGAFVLMALLLAAQAKEHSAPAPGSGKGDACMEAVTNNMMTCVDYMEVGAKEASPDAACCKGTKAVLKENADCICLALAAAPEYGLAVNLTRAAALPALCRIPNAPSLSKCQGKAAAPPAPVTAPAPHHGHHHHHVEQAPAPAPAKSSASTLSVVFASMDAAVVALLPLVFMA